MKSVVKVMLIWVISFSLVVPVGSVWAGDENEEERYKSVSFKRESDLQHAKDEIEKISSTLEDNLNYVRNGTLLDGLAEDTFEELDNNAHNHLKAKIKEIMNLSSRLKSLSENYKKKYSDDEDVAKYSWSKFQRDLKLDKDGWPIIVIKYKGEKRELTRLDFEDEIGEPKDKEKSDPSEKREKAKAYRHRVSLFDDEDEEISRSARDDERGRARTEFSGCPLAEGAQYNNEPGPGMKALGALGLGILGAGTIALGGINMSYAHKQRKSIGHMMERASARGDSPYLYMPAFASAINYNPLAGLGETLGPISMAISSLLMGGDRGYLTQQEFLKNQRLNMLRDMFSAQARAKGATSANASRTVTFEKQLQSIESGLGGILSQINNGAGGLNDAIKDLAEQARNEQSAMNRTAQLLTNAGRIFDARSRILSGILPLADQLLKGTQQFEEAVRNGDQSLRDSGADKLNVQFTDNFSSNSSFNRSGNTTGPNGFAGAPGFPQTGGGFGARFSGGGASGRFGFGPRSAAFPQ